MSPTRKMEKVSKFPKSENELLVFNDQAYRQTIILIPYEIDLSVKFNDKTGIDCVIEPIDGFKANSTKNISYIILLFRGWVNESILMNKPVLKVFVDYPKFTRDVFRSRDFGNAFLGFLVIIFVTPR